MFVYCVKIAKLLVTTGYNFGIDNKATTSEVIDLSDPTNRCEMFQDYPVEIMRATGQLIDGEFPLICGGTGLKTIRNFTYSKHEEENIL